jgi:predicted flap endonuclease-1-like 5' DNA nuclease
LGSVSLPDVDLSAELPKVDLPDLSVSGDLGSVSLPDVDLSAELPKVDLLDMSVSGDSGSVNLPDVDLSAELPKVDLPDMSVSGDLGSVSLPDVDLSAELPKVDMPDMSVSGDLGSVSLPDVDLSAGLPKVDLPDMSVSGDLGSVSLPDVDLSAELPKVDMPDIALVSQIATEKDDLEAINGVGPVYRKRLNEAGIYTFAQLIACAPAYLRQVVKAKDWQDVDTPFWIEDAKMLMARKLEFKGDNLIDINGIGPVYQKRLNDAGIYTFAQLITYTPEYLHELVNAEEWQNVDTAFWIEEAKQFIAGKALGE